MAWSEFKIAQKEAIQLRNEHLEERAIQITETQEISLEKAMNNYRDTNKINAPSEEYSKQWENQSPV